MGYESRIYIVEKYGETAEKIAVFNLSNVPISSTIRTKYPATDCELYEGDELITADKYGEPLREIPLSDLAELIKAEIIKDQQQDGYIYRRYLPLLGLLEGFNPNQWDALIALHYGY